MNNEYAEYVWHWTMLDMQRKSYVGAHTEWKRSKKVKSDTTIIILHYTVGLCTAVKISFPQLFLCFYRRSLNRIDYSTCMLCMCEILSSFTEAFVFASYFSIVSYTMEPECQHAHMNLSRGNQLAIDRPTENRFFQFFLLYIVR